MSIQTYLSRIYNNKIDNNLKMIIRYGYYYERRTNCSDTPLYVNVFAFSRDVNTGMVLFGHSFYKGDVVEFAELKPRLRMTAVKRLIKKPIVAYLPKGDDLDEFCKCEVNQKRIQPHMSLDGSLEFKDRETAYKHYRPYSVIYLLLQILRSSAYKDNKPIVREMVSNQDEGINVSNVKFRVTQMWDLKTNSLINIPLKNDDTLLDAYRGWAPENYNSVFKASSTQYKTIESMMEGHYLTIQLFKDGRKVHFSEVNGFTNKELLPIGLFSQTFDKNKVLAKNTIPKGVHIFRWSVEDKVTVFVSFVPDIEMGTLNYNYFIASNDYKQSRRSDWRRLGNYIAMKRLFKEPIYIVCDAESSIERRNAIKRRIIEHYSKGRSLNDNVSSSFASFFMYPVEKLADFIVWMVHG